jgi:hypothetical protein
MPEYIEREALLNVISETVLFTVRSGVKTPTQEMRGANKVIDRIKSAPAADVAEVRHGEWIDKPSGRYMHMASFCSVCWKKSGVGGTESNRHKPYCPNCGAKMDGKEDKNA